MLNKISESKGNMNMEEIMKMNEVLKPYQERSKDTDSENFRLKCFQIEVITIIKNSLQSQIRKIYPVVVKISRIT